jgi:hypothetical protein
MNHVKTKLLALAGLLVLVAATLSTPVRAECPKFEVDCGNDVRWCSGTDDGQGHCVYSEACLNCRNERIPELQ